MVQFFMPHSVVGEDRPILSAEYRLPLLANTALQRGLSAIAELLVWLILYVGRQSKPFDYSVVGASLLIEIK